MTSQPVFLVRLDLARLRANLSACNHWLMTDEDGRRQLVHMGFRPCGDGWLASASDLERLEPGELLESTPVDPAAFPEFTKPAGREPAETEPSGREAGKPPVNGLSVNGPCVNGVNGLSVNGLSVNGAHGSQLNGVHKLGDVLGIPAAVVRR